jgi:hypothetical protein
MMQKHDVDITEWIELAAAISAKSDQRQWNLGLAISASGSGSAAEDVSQQNVDQFSSPRANFAATAAGLVLQAQAMLFNLEKFFVQWEDFCWPLGSCGSKTAFSMGQYLFQMSGRSHHGLRLPVNLKLKIQKGNRHPPKGKSHGTHSRHVYAGVAETQYFRNAVTGVGSSRLRP